jgi:hypothetical protein
LLVKFHALIVSGVQWRQWKLSESGDMHDVAGLAMVSSNARRNAASSDRKEE